jgi:hypothetical protein
MPSIESVEEEVNKKPILDSNGNVANTPTDKKVLLDSKGNPIV